MVYLYIHATVSLFGTSLVKKADLRKDSSEICNFPAEALLCYLDHQGLIKPPTFPKNYETSRRVLITADF